MSHLLPSADLIARFRADLERLAPTPERLGVAVSGGPDSLALLVFAHAAFPGRVEAATVDHGLRSESAAEAAFVANICAELDCPHTILKVQVPDGRAGLQGEARQARYAALSAWAAERGISHLLTGHHADDQAETMLMRLQRGSGIAGLSGIREKRSEGASLTIVRPLLGWTRSELAQVVAGLEAVDDPSNRDTRFDRVTMRDFLAANPQFEPLRLARTAAALAEADEALDWLADGLFGERCTEAQGEWRIDPSGLPREVRRRLLSRVIARLVPDWKGSDDVEGLLAALESGGIATRAGVMASSSGDEWRVRSAPPRRPVNQSPIQH